MTKRIKMYSWVLAIIYVLSIAYTMASIVHPFTASLSENWNTVGQDEEMQEGLHNITAKLKAKKSEINYPEAVLNIKTGEKKQVLVRSMVANLEYPLGEEPIYISIVFYANLLFSLLVMAMIIYLPILSFNAIRSVTKNKIIDKSMVKKIKKIGYTLILYFIGSALLQWGSYAIARYSWALEDYDIVFGLHGVTVLMLAIVTLLLAELLQFALKMKEEQDLTI